jgi:uncharacterized protein YbdZ (MbtH family)
MAGCEVPAEWILKNEEGMKRAHFKGMVKNWKWTKPERLSRRAKQQAAAAPQIN